MTLKLSFAADEKFVEELDQAVTQYRRANPHRNCSRSMFMRDAVERAMTSAGAGSSSAPRVRTRERSGAAA
ncbi:hypothetical protein MKK88_03320 [Methylobacterium sp. E-005]|uniref:hypothetical protein n=1 Tax=Methylobacterium sp. E-005 TaxID=2836549 RepID=UPI001FB9D29A|nr:hypothetical protein [Methylobacterium sp. E-005]MCJ2085026.1 hypothetical protein [Methylobacterium sp. E-005]